MITITPLKENTIDTRHGKATPLVKISERDKTPIYVLILEEEE